MVDAFRSGEVFPDIWFEHDSAFFQGEVLDGYGAIVFVDVDGVPLLVRLIIFAAFAFASGEVVFGEHVFRFRGDGVIHGFLHKSVVRMWLLFGN